MYNYGRSPLGLRGLKFFVVHQTGQAVYRRSPLGLRGLKYRQTYQFVHLLASQPSWAAWIEIMGIGNFFGMMPESQPSWAAWIEIGRACKLIYRNKSQPSWAAWIEMI